MGEAILHITSSHLNYSIAPTSLPSGFIASIHGRLNHGAFSPVSFDR